MMVYWEVILENNRDDFFYCDYKSSLYFQVHPVPKEYNGQKMEINSTNQRSTTTTWFRHRHREHHGTRNHFYFVLVDHFYSNFKLKAYNDLVSFFSFLIIFSNWRNF